MPVFRLTPKHNSILFFQPRNNYSGSCRVLIAEIEDNYQLYDYKVITTGKEGFLNTLESNKIIYVNYPEFCGRSIPGVSFLIYSINLFFTALFWGLKYKTFYINTIMPFQAAVAGKLLRRTIIYHVHEKFISQTFVRRIAEKVFYRINAKRIYVSQYLRNAYFDNDEGSEVKYNRLPDSFRQNIKITPLEKRQLKNILMLTARASREKGVDIFYRIATLCPEYEFFLITEERVERVKRFINDSIPPNFHICYGGENVAVFYEKGDVLVNLSNPHLFIETFGMTILEGMAYGLPILAPNAGGPVELVKNNFNGFLIDDVNDINSIKIKLNAILNPLNYSSFSNNSLVMYKMLHN